jgi:hypothetical protein
MKVFGVHGELLEDGNKSAPTQDFFFNNAPMIELTDIDTCLEIMQLREKHFDDPAMLKAKTALRTDAIKQTAPLLLPNTNLVSMNFYTQSAFRFGEFYGHMALFPADDAMAQKTSEKVKSGQSGEVLSEWLKEHLEKRGAKYHIKVTPTVPRASPLRLSVQSLTLPTQIQLGTDPAHHPTEDASIVWDEATAPYQTLGLLEFPPQDSFTPERRTFWEDRMLLNPWGGLVAHRPLGSINRLRRIVYKQSRRQRDKLNATKSRDVKSIDEIP